MKKWVSRTFAFLWLLPLLALAGLLAFRAADRQRKEAAFVPGEAGAQYAARVPMEEMDVEPYRGLDGLSWAVALSGETSLVLKEPISYYREENGEKILVFTQEAGTRILRPGPYLGDLLHTLPTYEKGWRWGLALETAQGGSDPEWYYIRTEEVQALAAWLRQGLSRKEDEARRADNEAYLGWPLSPLKGEEAFTMDAVFYKNGVLLSPDLPWPFWETDCTLLACAAGVLALIPLGRGVVFLARRRGERIAARRVLAGALSVLWLLPLLALAGLLAFRAADRQRKEAAFVPGEAGAQYAAHVPMEEMDVEPYRGLDGMTAGTIPGDSLVLETPISYYREEDGEKIPVFTQEAGTEVKLHRLAIGYFTHTLPTYEKGWRWGLALETARGGSDPEWYYIRTEELQALAAQLRRQQRDAGATWLSESRRALRLESEKAAGWPLSPLDGEEIFTVDAVFYRGGVFLSPDLPWPFWGTDCTLLACAAGVLALIPLGRGAVFLARRAHKGKARC